MHQVVVQHFELDGIPQPMPRSTEHSVHKLPPQLTEGSLNALPDVAQGEFVGGSLIARYQQHLRLLGQASPALRTAIAQIPQRNPPVHRLDQGQRRRPIVPIAGRQDQIQDPPADMTEHVQLKAKEPPFAGFAKVRP